jgi:hypothetical protein
MQTGDDWKIVSLDKVPTGMKIIGNKWFFAKKRIGVKRA